MYHCVGPRAKRVLGAIAAAALLAALPVTAQPTTRGQRIGEMPEQRRQAVPGRFMPGRFIPQPFAPADDPATTGSRGGPKWGAALPEELKNIPALDKPLRELIEIQQERMQLARQRQAVAMARSRPAAEIMKEFHDLLRREDELTSRQRSVVEQLIGDLDAIQEQVARRRDALRRELETAPDEGLGQGRGPLESRRLWRSLRFYDMIVPRLEALAKDSDRHDAIRALLRGDWDAQRLDSADAETLRAQLREVRQQQERLQRKMQDLEQQIEEISDVLEALQQDRLGPPPVGGGAGVKPGGLPPAPAPAPPSRP
jgi:predicted transcriptional regulator